MATHRGIEATCQAVVGLLRDNYDPVAFNRDLDFEVLSTGGFTGGLTAGVSVFLYRIMVNDAHRTPPGRRTDTGELTQTQLPLDLHVILTASRARWFRSFAPWRDVRRASAAVTIGGQERRR